MHTDFQLRKPTQFHLDKSIGRGGFVTVTQCVHTGLGGMPRKSLCN